MSIFLLIWLGCIAACMIIASRKNNSVVGGFFLGALLGMIGVIIAAASSPGLPPAPHGMRAVKCTRCNAVQNIHPRQPQFECWQCHTVIPLRMPSRSPQAVVAPVPKAIAAKMASVRCFKCRHSQSVPAEQRILTCEQCGQKLKRLPGTKAS